VNGSLVDKKHTTNDDRKISHQVPIHYVSKALGGSKKYYSEMERILYAIVMSASRLYHYFEAARK
jgi:hypothetical protein